MGIDLFADEEERENRLKDPLLSVIEDAFDEKTDAAPGPEFDQLPGEQLFEDEEAARDLQELEAGIEAFKTARETNPDKEAETKRLSDKSGYPEEIVRENPEGVKESLQAQQLAETLKNSPKLKKAAVDLSRFGHDDFENLGIFERMYRDMSVGLERGMLTRELGMAHRKLMGEIFRDTTGIGELTSEDKQQLRDRIKEIKEELPGSHGSGGFIEAAANALGTFIEGIPQVVAAGATAAGAYATGATLLGPGGTLAGGFTGFGIGATAEVFRQASAIEGGILRDALLEEEVEEDIANRVGEVGGALAGLLETVGQMKFMAEPFKKAIKKRFLDNVKKKVLEDATKKRGLAAGITTFGKTVSKTVAGETATELGQEIVQVTGEEVGKAIDPGVHEKITLDEFGERMTEVFVETLKAMTVLGTPGGFISVVSEHNKANEADRNEAYMREMGKNVQESKLMARDEKAHSDFVDTVTEDDDGQIYIDANQLQEVFQDDTPTLLEEIGATDQFEDAINRKGDIVIPLSTYTSKIARDVDAHAKIYPHTKFVPGGTTPFQKKQAIAGEAEWKAKVEEIMAARQDDPAFIDSAEQLFQVIRQKIIDTKRVNPEVADQYASLHQGMAVTLAHKLKGTKLEMLPHEVYAMYPLDIRGEPLTTGGLGVLNQERITAITQEIDRMEALGEEAVATPEYQELKNELAAIMGQEAKTRPETAPTSEPQELTDELEDGARSGLMMSLSRAKNDRDTDPNSNVKGKTDEELEQIYNEGIQKINDFLKIAKANNLSEEKIGKKLLAIKGNNPVLRFAGSQITSEGSFRRIIKAGKLRTGTEIEKEIRGETTGDLVVGETSTFFLPDGTPIELEVVGVSEAGTVIVRNEKGEEEIVGGRLDTQSAASPTYRLETLEGTPEVGSLSNEVLDAAIERTEEKVAEQGAKGTPEAHASMLRELNALKLERKRRKGVEAKDPDILGQEGVEKPWTVKSRGDGDLYIRRVGNDAGKVFRERQGPNDLAITFNQEALLPDYMYYLLQSLYPQLNARKRGTAQQAIKIGDVDEIITGHFTGAAKRQELYQEQFNPNWYYSVLAEEVANLTPGKAQPKTGQDWLNAIKKLPGVSHQEIFWTGLEDFLATDTYQQRVMNHQRKVDRHQKVVEDLRNDPRQAQRKEYLKAAQAELEKIKSQPGKQRLISRDEIMNYLDRNGIQIITKIDWDIEAGDQEIPDEVYEREREIIDEQVEEELEYEVEGQLDGLYEDRLEAYIDEQADALWAEDESLDAGDEHPTTGETERFDDLDDAVTWAEEEEKTNQAFRQFITDEHEDDITERVRTRLRDDFADGGDALMQAREEWENEQAQGDPHDYESSTLPGGSEYKNMLLVLPDDRFIPKEIIPPRVTEIRDKIYEWAVDEVERRDFRLSPPELRQRFKQEIILENDPLLSFGYYVGDTVYRFADDPNVSISQDHFRPPDRGSGRRPTASYSLYAPGASGRMSLTGSFNTLEQAMRVVEKDRFPDEKTKENKMREVIQSVTAVNIGVDAAPILEEAGFEKDTIAYIAEQQHRYFSWERYWDGNHYAGRWFDRQVPSEYHGGHFDGNGNIVAWVRFKTRASEAIIPGQPGPKKIIPRKKVLMIEEFQSDWGAALRKHHSNTPRGPFVEDTVAWYRLAMKRMIVYAMENGFDRIEWTSGVQQSDRQRKFNYLAGVRWDPDTKILALRQKGESVFTQAPEAQVEAIDLPKYLLPNVAARLLDAIPPTHEQQREMLRAKHARVNAKAEYKAADDLIDEALNRFLTRDINYKPVPASAIRPADLADLFTEVEDNHYILQNSEGIGINPVTDFRGNNYYPPITVSPSADIAGGEWEVYRKTGQARWTGAAPPIEWPNVDRQGNFSPGGRLNRSVWMEIINFSEELGYEETQNWGDIPEGELDVDELEAGAVDFIRAKGYQIIGEGYAEEPQGFSIIERFDSLIEAKRAAVEWTQTAPIIPLDSLGAGTKRVIKQLGLTRIVEKEQETTNKLWREKIVKVDKGEAKIETLFDVTMQIDPDEVGVTVDEDVFKTYTFKIDPKERIQAEYIVKPPEGPPGARAQQAENLFSETLGFGSRSMALVREDIEAWFDAHPQMVYPTQGGGVPGTDKFLVDRLYVLKDPGDGDQVAVVRGEDEVIYRVFNLSTGEEISFPLPGGLGQEQKAFHRKDDAMLAVAEERGLIEPAVQPEREWVFTWERSLLTPHVTEKIDVYTTKESAMAEILEGWQNENPQIGDKASAELLEELRSYGDFTQRKRVGGEEFEEQVDVPDEAFYRIADAFAAQDMEKTRAMEAESKAVEKIKDMEAAGVADVSGRGRNEKVLTGLDVQIAEQGLHLSYDQMLPMAIDSVLQDLGVGDIDINLNRLTKKTTKKKKIKEGEKKQLRKKQAAGKTLTEDELQRLSAETIDITKEVAAGYSPKGTVDPTSYTPGAQPGFDIAPVKQVLVDEEGKTKKIALMQEKRGSFQFGEDITKDASIINLFKGADLSTFLHETGHFFFEVTRNMANHPDAPQQIKDDMGTLLKFVGVSDISTWNNMSLEERRSGHEQVARAFEAYLFEGKAPTINLSSMFRRFRDWLMWVYKRLKDLDVELTDDVRSVFDRMLATSEEIKANKEVTDMLPLFTSQETVGMTVDEWAAYQNMVIQEQEEADEILQAKDLKNMKWLSGARGKVLSRLQRQERERRLGVQKEAAVTIGEQPVYQARQYLRTPLEKKEKPKRDLKNVDPANDSLFTAIAKLGGLDKMEVVLTWGVDPAEKLLSGLGAAIPVLRKTKGLSINAMGEALAADGYLPPDEAGRWDPRDFEERFFDELSGNKRVSIQNDTYDVAEAYENFIATEEGYIPLNLEDLKGGKLSAQILRETFPAEDALWKQLPSRGRYAMVTEEGMDPQLIAQVLGFGSVTEMIRELVTAPSMREAVKQETDRRMMELYGDLNSEEAKERAIREALHGPLRERMVHAELTALAKRVGSGNVLARAARELAKDKIAGMDIKSIRPNDYIMAERRANRNAEKALIAGNLQEATDHKRAAVLNYHFAKAATKALEEVDRAVRYFNKFDSKPVRGNIDLEYLDQIDKLLENYDLRKSVAMKIRRRRKGLQEWVNTEIGKGNNPIISDAMMRDIGLQHYRDIPMEELRGLRDSIKNIEHLGKQKRQLILQEKKVKLDDAAMEIKLSIYKFNKLTGRLKKRHKVLGEELPQDRPGKHKAGFYAEHRKLANIGREADGYQENGPFWRFVTRPMNQAADWEAEQLELATQGLTELFDVYSAGEFTGTGVVSDMAGKALGAEETERLYKRVLVPEVGLELAKMERIMIALNWGNADNRIRVKEGFKWTDQQVEIVLDTLDARDWAFVESVWNFINEYWPQIEAKEKRVSGVAPEKVKGLPVTTKFGTFNEAGEAGYFPITFTREDKKTHDQITADQTKRSMLGEISRATTARSHTKARMESAGKKRIRTDFGVIFEHVGQVIHDLAWHEFLIDNNRLLNHPDVIEAMEERMGIEKFIAISNAIKDVAAGEVQGVKFFEKAFNYLRAGVSISAMGWNLGTALLQPFGITQSMVRVGPIWVAKAMLRFFSGAAAMEGAVKEIFLQSSMMRLRAKTMDREINDVRNKIIRTGFGAKVLGPVREGFFYIIVKAQQLADIPTWLAAQEKARAAGYDELTVIELANQAVIDSQGSGHIKDLAQIQRGSPLLKLWTNFMSYFQTTFNLSMDSLGRTKWTDPMSIGRLAADFFLLYTAPILLSFYLREAILKGECDHGRDWQCVGIQVAKEHASYLLSGVLVFRELASAVQGFTGYQGPAGARFFSDMTRAAQQAWQGEIDEALLKAWWDAGGVLFHFPGNQLKKIFEGFMALQAGDTDIPTAPLFGYSKRG